MLPIKSRDGSSVKIEGFLEDTTDLLTEQEGLDLLKLAGYALKVSQRQLTFLPKITPSDRLKQRRGLFVSLWNKTTLRGCIGCVNPAKPLEELIVEATLKSAIKDPRFPPIQSTEITELTIEISIMTEPKPIDIAKIEIGRHGLIAACQEKMGLLLPYVAKENNWDVTTYLEQACLKGQLPKDLWKQGARIFGFEVQIFKTTH